MVGVARIELATPAMSRQGHRPKTHDFRRFLCSKHANMARTKRDSAPGLPHFYRTGRLQKESI